jgi:hypothetical protein
MMTYHLPVDEPNLTAQPWQSAIGVNYDLPMVSYFDAIAPELTNGTITIPEISPDNVHPNDMGHAYAAQFLEQALQHTIDNFPAGTPVDPIPDTQAALYSSDFEFTSLVEGNGKWGPSLNPTANQGWVAVESSPGGNTSQHDSGLESSTPGSTLDFTVTGSDVLIGYWQINGPMGQASVTLDGGLPVVLDGYFASSTGAHVMTRVGTGLTVGPHQVHITLLDTNSNGGSGTTFDVLSVGAGGTQP